MRLRQARKIAKRYPVGCPWGHVRLPTWWEAWRRNDRANRRERCKWDAFKTALTKYYTPERVQALVVNGPPSVNDLLADPDDDPWFGVDCAARSAEDVARDKQMQTHPLTEAVLREAAAQMWKRGTW